MVDFSFILFKAINWLWKGKLPLEEFFLLRLAYLFTKLYVCVSVCTDIDYFSVRYLASMLFKRFVTDFIFQL